MKGVKMVIDKKIVLDNKGKPYEVIISYKDFKKIEEMLGLNLTNDEVITLKKAQKAREQGDFKDFVKEEDF